LVAHAIRSHLTFKRPALKTHLKFILYIRAMRKYTEFLRHVAYFIFHKLAFIS